MKCKVCKNEISENGPICDKCGFDSVGSDFPDPEKLQTYYRTIGSDWKKRVFLIGSTYEKFLENIYEKGPQSRCAEILNLPKSTISNHLFVYENFLAVLSKYWKEFYFLKTLSAARRVCEDYKDGIPVIFFSEDDMQKYFVCKWDKLDFTREWKLIKTSDSGQYKEGKVLEIDLLAQNIKKENHWLVIELKLRKAKDKELHQVLRYMRWIRKEKLSEEDGNVKGWIIARRPINKSLSLHIKKDYPDLKYFIYSFDKNKKLCLEDS